MIYLTGSTAGPQARARYSEIPELGLMLSPEKWVAPWTRFYACDNNVYLYSHIGPRPDPNWWEREGETKWLKMLDKIPQNHPNTVFIGGTTKWKFATLAPACHAFLTFGVSVHVGRVNGERRVRMCRRAGATSADGSGLNRHWNAEAPGIVRGLRDEPIQKELFA